MSIENHVVSLELAKQLWEAGIKIDSYFEWSNWGHTSQKPGEPIIWHPSWGIGRNHNHVLHGSGSVGNPELMVRKNIEYYPAPLASELGELLRNGTQIEKNGNEYFVYRATKNGGITQHSKSMPDAMAKMLLYLSNLPPSGEGR